MKKYTYLDYKICLSLLKQIEVKKGLKLQFETIDGPEPITLNDLDLSNLREVHVTLLVVNLELKEGNYDYMAFEMHEEDCFVFYLKDGSPEVEDEIDDYREAVYRFRAMIDNFRKGRKEKR